jgi:hypothetical protein
LIRGHCVRVGEQQQVGLCWDTKLDHLVEWDLDFCNKLLPTIIIIIIIIISSSSSSMDVSCHRSFLPDTSLEPAVNHTAQASSFTLLHTAVLSILCVMFQV